MLIFHTANIDAPVIDGVNTTDLLLVDQAGVLDGTVVFEEDVAMRDVMSGTGFLDGCDILAVCSGACDAEMAD